MARKLVNLKVGSDTLIPQVFAGINTSNLLTQTSHDIGIWSYTATQDCYVTAWVSGGAMKVDNVQLNRIPAITVDDRRYMWLKKGQTISFTRGGAGLVRAYVYGLKY